MIVRFGFVAMTTLLEGVTPSRTMTYATFGKQADRQTAIERLEAITKDNLRSTLSILKHSQRNDIDMYRFSSKLVPLATHEGLQGWNPCELLAPAFREVGDYAKRSGMRTSFHPDHFCVFSTPRPEVLRNSIKDLVHHVRMLEAMELNEESKCNIHMGGAYGDKPSASDRFIAQFGELAPEVKARVTLENDDKTFDVKETLAAAEAVGVPMVLDIHHYAVNPGDVGWDELLSDLWPRILLTWKKERERLGIIEERGLPAKIHVSSPKSISDPRGHADNVEAEPLLHFLRRAASSCDYMDCMLEAKRKDGALLKLMEDLKALEATGEGVRVLNGGTVEIFPY